MADIEYDDTMGGELAARGFELGKVVNVVGALVSLALIAGLGWWGYQLLVRDVTGVPVIKAFSGPMRIAPDDPGGESADYQGLAVNNIPAQGEAEAPADRVVLSPGPAALAPEDRPQGQLQAAITPVARPQDRALPTPSSPSSSAGEAVADAVVSRNAGDQAAPASTASAGAADTADTSPADNAEAAQASVIEATLKLVTQSEPGGQAAAPAVIPASVKGVSKSLVPLARPAQLAAALARPDAPRETASDPAAAEGAREASLATASDAAAPAASMPVPPGTPLAQIGAFNSAEIAQAEWEKANGRFAEFMSGKTRVIQRAEAGGTVFYRLRVMGFSDLSDARRFCAALSAQNANCIPVVTR